MRDLLPSHALLEQYLVPIQLLLAMFGMGATLKLSDFGLVFRQPGALALGIGVQLIVIPLLALGFVQVLSLEPGWAVGLLLVSVVPGGAFSNLLTYFARGNVPLSIAVTTISTLGCVLSVPLVLGLTAGEYLPVNFQFPAAQIVRDILSFLLAPLGVGMLVRRFLEGQAAWLSTWAVRLAMLLILVLTVSALGSGRIDVPAYGWRPPLVIVGFAACVALLAPQLLRLARQYDDVNAALSIEVTLRNVGIGLLLVRFFFPEQPELNGHVLYTCLFYAGLSTPFCLPVLFRHRYGKSPALGRRPYRDPRLELGASAEQNRAPAAQPRVS